MSSAETSYGAERSGSSAGEVIAQCNALPLFLGVFQRKALRIFAGMLFGSSAGVLWGVWYHAAHWPSLEKGDEIVKMTALLYATMVGAGAGFFAGLIVGMARNSSTAMVLSMLAAVVVVLFPAGFGAFAPSSFMQAHLAAAGLLLGATLASAVAIPPSRVTATDEP